MCRAHHNVDEFATALRAVGEPMRGLPVKEISVGRMLDGLFAITRDFDMQTQPHLLLLQKTMVMDEGVATALDPDINMWETAEPFLKEWIRSELGPEAYYADRIIELVRALQEASRADRPHRRILSAARRGAPPAPPLAGHRRDRAPAIGGAMRSPAQRRRGCVGALLLFVLRLARMARVLLIVGGGIAAYKSLELVRLLGRPATGHARADQGRRAFRHRDEPRRARREPGPHSLWELKDEVEIGHIQL